MSFKKRFRLDHVSRAQEFGDEIGESSTPQERVEAFKAVISGGKTMDEAQKEYVRRIQELRRSSAASKVNRDLPRKEDKRRAIKEQD